MSPAQLDKARSVWLRGEATQQEGNSRVWRVRSYSGMKSGDPEARKWVFVTLVSDYGAPAFSCTCPHGKRRRIAQCWHAKTVARIYRIMIDQRISREKREERAGAC
nr:MAG TPA: Complement C5-like protein [Caudoviricetes sp.]